MLVLNKNYYIQNIEKCLNLVKEQYRARACKKDLVISTPLRSNQVKFTKIKPFKEAVVAEIRFPQFEKAVSMSKLL